MKELLAAFRGLKGAPLALWLVIFAYAVDITGFYGAIPLMKPFLAHDIGISPGWASTTVSLFTGAISIIMILVGPIVDKKLGIRLGLLLALLIAFAGRALFGGAAFAGGFPTAIVALVVLAVGEGLLQPVAFSGVKRYTTEETSAMGFAVFYALFNLSVTAVGPMSAAIRTRVDAAHEAGGTRMSGFAAVIMVCSLFSLIGFFGILGTLTRKREAESLRSDEPAPEGAEDAAGAVGAAGAAGGAPKAKKGPSPLANGRFLFFIFALLPVRTLFAHQWLTMPDYVLRAYSKEVQDSMELFVDSMNPAVIFFGVPIITALTKRFSVVTMMIAGTFVSAASSFILCGPRSALLLTTYFVVFSIGEAMWSSRFYELAAELAPPGMTAQYMGVANFPWLIAKTTTGFYAGWVLERFVPADGPKNPSTMWMIYGAVALLSPLLLLLARAWMKDLGKAPRAPGAA